MSGEENRNLTSGDEIQSGEDDFEFAVSGDGDNDFEFAVPGDGIQIETVYPVFNRSLLLDPDPISPLADLRSGSTSSSSSSSSSADDDDDDAKYCVWNPSSPGRCKKSSSTGSAAGSSASRRFRIRDLVSGRSRSDGKEKFAFVEAKPNPNSKKNVKPGEMDLLTAHRLFYGKEGEKGAKGGRAYLPQRPGSGLFANGNGLSRTKFPF